jgi:hypothetical protein
MEEAEVKKAQETLLEDLANLKKDPKASEESALLNLLHIFREMDIPDVAAVPMILAAANGIFLRHPPNENSAMFQAIRKIWLDAVDHVTQVVIKGEDLNGTENGSGEVTGNSEDIPH